MAVIEKTNTILFGVTVCLNALRLNFLKIRDGKHDRPLRRHVKRKESSEKAGKPPVRAILRVEGMMCPHCEMTVQKALEKLDFIESAAADHNAGTVEITLSGGFDDAEVGNAVQEKGYEYRGQVQ